MMMTILPSSRQADRQTACLGAESDEELGQDVKCNREGTFMNTTYSTCALLKSYLHVHLNVHHVSHNEADQTSERCALSLSFFFCTFELGSTNSGLFAENYEHSKLTHGVIRLVRVLVERYSFRTSLSNRSRRRVKPKRLKKSQPFFNLIRSRTLISSM